MEFPALGRFVMKSVVFGDWPLCVVEFFCSLKRTTTHDKPHWTPEPCKKPASPIWNIEHAFDDSGIAHGMHMSPRSKITTSLTMAPKNFDGHLNTAPILAQRSFWATICQELGTSALIPWPDKKHQSLQSCKIHNLRAPLTRPLVQKITTLADIALLFSHSLMWTSY